MSDIVKHINKEKPPVCLHALGQDLANRLHSEGHKCWKAIDRLLNDKSACDRLAGTHPDIYQQLLNAHFDGI
jgi:hypothetical protein